MAPVFRIALRDLEIRGAGNILGAQQSGHINTVGYELYCRLLSEAVKRLKNEPVEKEPETVIDLGFASYIPKSYIHSDRQRMEVYRRISVARDPKDIDRLKTELRDLFGPVPEQVTQLLELSQIRIRAAKWNIQSIIVQGPDVIFKFPEGATGARPVRPLPRHRPHPRPKNRPPATRKILLRTQNPAGCFTKIIKEIKQKPEAPAQGTDATQKIFTVRNFSPAVYIEVCCHIYGRSFQCGINP